MISKSFLLKLFEAFYMQRWNDRMRPFELVEADKQAHKMITAWTIARLHPEPISETELIEAHLFEMLQRIEITDLKPQVYYRIKQNKEEYLRLNRWIIDRLKPLLQPIGHGLFERFTAYFLEEQPSTERHIMEAAHSFASRWEFGLIRQLNSFNADTEEIAEHLDNRWHSCSDLPGVITISTSRDIQSFLNLCGQLRFQYRWSNRHRSPKTAVLGHMLMVAIYSYLFSLEAEACPQRAVNNYFTGLFHDLPEVLTRDIISPVKRSIAGMEELIAQYEAEQMEQAVYSIVPAEWKDLLALYTHNEFSDTVVVNGQRTMTDSQTISEQYNSDIFSPRDGSLVRAADRLAAYIEAYEAVKNGSGSPDLKEALTTIAKESGNARPGGVDISRVYADFSS